MINLLQQQQNKNREQEQNKTRNCEIGQFAKY